jgi:hypothetical protein
MVSVTAICPAHGAFSSELSSVTNRGGEILTRAGSCPTCGRQTAVMKSGYDFTNFAVAKALATPEWTAAALDTVRDRLQGAIVVVRTSRDDEPADDAFGRLNQHEPALAAALRARIEGRSRTEVLELLAAVLEIVTAMTTAASNGRLTTQLKNALVHTSLP